MKTVLQQASDYSIDLGKIDPDSFFELPADLLEVSQNGVRTYLSPMYCATEAGADQLAAVVKGLVTRRPNAGMLVSPMFRSVVFPDGSETLAGWYLWNWLTLHNYTWDGGNWQFKNGVWVGVPLTWTAPPALPASKS